MLVLHLLLVTQGGTVLIPIPPSVVIQEVTDMVIDQYSLGFICDSNKWCVSPTASQKKKRKKIKYDRACARECTFCNWFDPSCRFHDRQFERTFRLKQRMVEDILNKLASHDSFWTETRDCCGELLISPYVKFLAAQKMICYGASFSTFKDYFQMRERERVLHDYACQSLFVELWSVLLSQMYICVHPLLWK